jgi:flagellar hook-associated protein 2
MTTATTNVNSAGTLSSPGIGSGLDVNGIVSKLMTVESLPLNLLQTKQASYQAKLSAYGSLQGSVAALQTAAQGLTSASTYTGYSATSSDTTVLTATASTGAVAGIYPISVTSLATANTIESNPNNATPAAVPYSLSDTFNSGNLAITVGSTTTNVAINSSNNTLSGIASAINNANAGVTASVVNDGTTNHLVMTAKSTGATNAIAIVVTPDGVTTGTQALTGFDTGTASNYAQVQAAADAKFSVNGLALTRPSNTISDVVSGVTFTLLKGSGATSTLTVARDGGSASTAINTFVTAYNALIKSVQTLTSYTASTSTGSALLGDFGVQSLQSQLPNLAMANVTGLAGGINSLTNLGITVQKDGTLAVDSAKLSAALSDQTKDVAGMMTQTTAGNQGIAVRFNNVLTQMLGPTGLFQSQADSINASIKSNSDLQSQWNTRLVQIQAAYLAQFNALDTAIASMQSTQSFLTQQLTGLTALANFNLK